MDGSIFTISYELLPTGPLMLESQAAAQALIRQHTSRAIKTWDKLVRAGTDCHMHPSDHGYVLCIKRNTALHLNGRSVVTRRGICAFEGGDANWWRLPGAFKDAEQVFAEEVDPRRSYFSYRDALSGVYEEEFTRGESKNEFHKIWMYDYTPRWLECEGVRVWRMDDIARLRRVKSGIYDSPQRLYTAAMLEILYEEGGCVLEPHQSRDTAAPPALTLAAVLAGAKCGKARERLDPMLVYLMHENETRSITFVPESDIGMVVYVNLDRCAHKRDAMDKRLFVDGSFGTLHIERFAAVDGSSLNVARMLHEKKLSLKKYHELIDRSGVVSKTSYPFTDGALGCTESHIRIMQRAVQNNVNTLVFEDDVHISDSFEKALCACELGKRSDEWELFYCGFIRDNIKFKLNDFISTCKHLDGTYGYAIRPSAARKILDSIYPINQPIDIHIFNTNLRRPFRICGMSNEHLSTVRVWDDPSASSIARTHREPMKIAMYMFVMFESIEQATPWRLLHPDWDVRFISDPSDAVMENGGVYIDSRSVLPPTRSIDHLLYGIRGFVLAADASATTISPLIYGFERNHPLFPPGTILSFQNIQRLWTEDNALFLRHAKLFHQSVFQCK
jgi:GR25 family glycosyltransferase involved in LPS biosynthesis